MHGKSNGAAQPSLFDVFPELAPEPSPEAAAQSTALLLTEYLSQQRQLRACFAEIRELKNHIRNLQEWDAGLAAKIKQLEKRFKK